jgi:hypothetical protein
MWRDVTAYVRDGTLQITRGRQDQFSDVSPGRCSMVLDNADGRFTAGNASSPYYPYVKKGRRIRVGVRYPSAADWPGNFLTANQASMETSVADWVPLNTAGTDPTLASSTAHPHDGTKGLLITWVASAASVQYATTPLSGLTIGRSYTATAWVWVPVGHPDVRLIVAGPISGTATSVKGAFAQISLTWTALTVSTTLYVQLAGAATAGQQCWVDEVRVDEAGANTTFTTDPPSLYWRFDGYVEEWPQTWPGGSAAYAEASISCLDRLSRLGRKAKFRSVVEQELLSDVPKMYWPMGDPEGSTQAGQVATSGYPNLTVTQLGSGGTLTFGQAVGAPTDGLSAPIFARVDPSNGKYLTATTNASVVTTAGLSVVASFNADTVAEQGIIRVSFGATSPDRLEIGLDASGFIQARRYNSAGVNAFNLVGAVNLADSHTHRVAFTQNTAGNDNRLYIDGSLVGSTGVSSKISSYSTVQVGGWTGGFLFNGAISHAAVYAKELSLARVGEHDDVQTTGFAGESSNGRVVRYARYAGIPAASVSAETGLSTSIAHIDTTGQSPLDVLQRITRTENGLLFFDTIGRLVFHARSHRYNQAVAFTLNAANAEVGGDLQFVEDDFGLVNDLTASRQGGATVRVVNQSSIDEFDSYVDTMELVTTSDNEVLDAATWRVNTYGTPSRRCPGVSVALHELPALITTVIAADLGARFLVTGLPSQAPSPSVDLNVEGYTETLGDTAWTMSFNASPGVQSDVWVLDSATYSVLDSTTRLAY